MKMKMHYRPTLLFACYIFLLLAMQGFTTAAQDSRAPRSISIDNFGKVNDNYYRGSQPSAEQFENLKRLGVKTIIDLRKDRVEQSSDWARAAGLQYINIPLTTKKAATEDQTNEFLKLVNDPANQPVYVHCKGGRHRTGQMTAIFRITNDGWTSDQAYTEMKKYDFEDSFFYPRSLKKYVFSYYDKFRAQKNSKSVTETLTPVSPKPVAP